MGRSKRIQVFVLILPILFVTLALFLAPLGYTFLTTFYHHPPGAIMEPVLTLENYRKFFFDYYYWRVVGNTVLVGAVTTLITLLIGYPLAYQLARRPCLKTVQLVLLISPLLVNIVIRTYGWKVLLADYGIVNKALMGMGLIREPIAFVNSIFGVFVALAHVLLPYMVLSISSVLEGIDQSIIEAAHMLGATKTRVFWKVILPLSLPGVVAGSMLVFVRSAGSFMVPALMGGGRVRTIPTLMYQYMTHLLNWPFGAMLAFFMTFLTVLIVLAFSSFTMRRQTKAELLEE